VTVNVRVMHVVLVGWYVPGITENMLHKSRQFKKNQEPVFCI